MTTASLTTSPHPLFLQLKLSAAKDGADCEEEEEEDASEGIKGHEKDSS